MELSQIQAQLIMELEAYPFPPAGNTKEALILAKRMDGILGKALAVLKELKEREDAEQVSRHPGADDDA